MNYRKTLLKQIEQHKKWKSWRGLMGVYEESFIHVLRAKEKALLNFISLFSLTIALLHLKAIISPAFSWHTFLAYGTIAFVCYCIYERFITSKLIDYIIKENVTTLEKSIISLVSDAEADAGEQLKQPTTPDL